MLNIWIFSDGKFNKKHNPYLKFLRRGIILFMGGFRFCTVFYNYIDDKFYLRFIECMKFHKLNILI